MAFGDIGGPVTDTVITCCTRAAGEVNIAKGDAVALVGNYEVCSAPKYFMPVIGQALDNCNANTAAIPIRVKGVNVYRYAGCIPFGAFYCHLYGLGVILSIQVPGAVEFSEKGTGKILAFDLESKTVHVLH